MDTKHHSGELSHHRHRHHHQQQRHRTTSLSPHTSLLYKRRWHCFETELIWTLPHPDCYDDPRSKRPLSQADLNFIFFLNFNWKCFFELSEKQPPTNPRWPPSPHSPLARVRSASDLQAARDVILRQLLELGQKRLARVHQWRRRFHFLLRLLHHKVWQVKVRGKTRLLLAFVG